LQGEKGQILKYRAIYEVCKEAYIEERERREKLDRKCQIFLVIVGFEITVLGFIYKSLENVIQNWSCLSAIVLILVVVSWISILTSLVFLARSLLLRDFKTYPSLEVITTEFQDKAEGDLFASMANHFKKIEAHNIKEYERKAQVLKVGSLIAIGSAFLIAGAFCMLIYLNVCSRFFKTM